MLYPGYDPYVGLPPAILHYGSDFKLSRDPTITSDAAIASDAAGADSIYFNKMSHANLDLYEFIHSSGCRPDEPAGPAAFFFPEPPPPLHGEPKARRSGRDLLCILHLQMLNAALCDFYKQRCSHRVVCPLEVPLEQMNSLFEWCHDEHPNCANYAAQGECVRNPEWMIAHCAASCNTCKMRFLPLLLGPSQLAGPDATLYLEPARASARASSMRRSLQRSMLVAAHEEGCRGVCSFQAVRLRYGLVSQGVAFPHEAGGEDPAAEAVGGRARRAPAEGAAAEAAATQAQSSRREASDAGGHECTAGGDHGGGGSGSKEGGGGEEGGPRRVAWPSWLGHRIESSIGTADFGGSLRCLALGGLLVAGGDGCNPVADSYYHARVVLLERGSCMFAVKATHAQAAGARAVLVHEPLHSSSGQAFSIGGDGVLSERITIPLLSIDQACIPLPTVACRYLPLRAVTYRCVPLHTVACR